MQTTTKTAKFFIASWSKLLDKERIIWYYYTVSTVVYCLYIKEIIKHTKNFEGEVNL